MDISTAVGGQSLYFLATTTGIMDSASPEAHEQEEKAAVAGSPGDFLKNIVGKKVKVRIGSGVDYHGTSQLAPRNRPLEPSETSP